MKLYNIIECKALYSLQGLYDILRSFNRYNELHKLIQWAQRKRLSGPLRLYQIRLEDEEKRLFRYTIASPRLVAIARLLFLFNRLITPAPQYFPKGSASAYRYNSLTKPTKSHSILLRLT